MTQTLTTERLKDLTFHHSKLISPASREEAAAMARELLANREAQPVGFISAKHGPVLYGEHIGLPAGTHFYTAPPAPAVPDFGSLTKLIVGRLIDCGAAGDDSIADAETFVYNACRAAMLAQSVSQGYKLNSPETPDGWIPCTEQTPDADGAYWCWFGKEEPSIIQQRVCIWINRNNEWCDSAVTHWMPLPAAPAQGEKQ